MSTASRSAADMLEVGWPEPADVLARIESTLSCWPSSRSSSNVTSAADSTAWSPLMLHLISPSDGWVSRFPARPIGLVQEHPTLPFSIAQGAWSGSYRGTHMPAGRTSRGAYSSGEWSPPPWLADLDREVRWPA